VTSKLPVVASGLLRFPGQLGGPTRNAQSYFSVTVPSPGVFPVPVRLAQVSPPPIHFGGQVIGLEVTLSVARNVKTPAAEDEDESTSARNPKQAAPSATTIIRFILTPLSRKQ
jgi:hypothetical protein